MGLDKVIENIQKEGKEKVTSILKDAESQVVLIFEAKQKMIDNASIKKKQELEKQITVLKTQDASSIEIEVKKIRLNAEKEILTQTYQECLKALSTLPHKTILSSLIKKAQKELPDAAYIYSNARDEPHIRLQTKIPYGDSIDTLGGIIMENEEKNIKLDYRYETIAELVWERSLKEIAKKLFT